MLIAFLVGAGLIALLIAHVLDILTRGEPD